MNFEYPLNFLCELIKENSAKISIMSAITSIASAAISWQQAKTAKRKIRIELYQARINIYTTISKIYQKIISGSQFESIEVNEINKIFCDLSDRVYESELLFHGDKILIEEIKSINNDLFFIFQNKIKGANQYLHGKDAAQNGEAVSSRISALEGRMLIIKNRMVKYISFDDK